MLHYLGPNRGFDRHRQYPWTVPATEVSKVYQGCASRPRRPPQPSPIQRMAARLPAQIVFRLRGRNDLSFQLSVGHAFNMTRGPSVLNRHRQGHYSQPTIRPCLVANSISHLVILSQSNHCLIKQVSTYISQVTGNHPTSTGLSKLSIDSVPIYIGQGR